MKYDRFKEELNFLEIQRPITDEIEYANLLLKVKNGEELPENISYDEAEYDGSKINLFYENFNEEGIEALLKISTAKSLNSISKSLLYFKILSILSISIYLLIIAFTVS